VSSGDDFGTMMSRSCPPKPVIGSLPVPATLNKVPNLKLPPTPSSSADSSARSMFSGVQFPKRGSPGRSMFVSTNSTVYAASCPARNGTWIQRNLSRTSSRSSSKSSTPQGTPKDVEVKPTILSFLEESSLKLKSQLLDSKVNDSQRRRKSSEGDRGVDRSDTLSVDLDEQDIDDSASETFGVFELDDDDCKPCGW